MTPAPTPLRLTGILSSYSPPVTQQRSGGELGVEPRHPVVERPASAHVDVLARLVEGIAEPHGATHPALGGFGLQADQVRPVVVARVRLPVVNIRAVMQAKDVGGQGVGAWREQGEKCAGALQKR